MTAQIIDRSNLFLFLQLDNDIERIRNPNAVAVVRIKSATAATRKRIEAVLAKQARDVRDAMPSDCAFPEGA